MQCLTLTPIIGITGLWREHQSKRIDDVGARFIPRTPLAKDTGYLGNRRDHPAFLAGLIDDRQIKLLRHTANDTQRARDIQQTVGKLLQRLRFAHEPNTLVPSTASSRLRRAKNREKLLSTGSSGQVAKNRKALDRLLEALLDPAGREARRRAADMIRRADRGRG
jgi:hypothetical protein